MSHRLSRHLTRLTNWSLENNVATIYDLDALNAKLREKDLTLATLCDLVLDDRDTDRSDDHLVRVIGQIMRDYRSINWDVLRAMQGPIMKWQKEPTK